MDCIFFLSRIFFFSSNWRRYLLFLRDVDVLELVALELLLDVNEFELVGLESLLEYDC